ncbi:MAG TPA: DUF2695 domain-containing protein [Candidatus Acidoferrales bacterium]|nr:DUF2695 domain-containing protein [Candidatus Acidoferrales bacterium]
MSDDRTPDYIASIAAGVLRVLTARAFFDALDEALCPTDESKPAVPCRHTYKNSDRILTHLGFATDDFEDIYHVLRSRGGFCDCEILYNVVEASGLKEKCWKAEYSRLTSQRRDK